MMIHINIQNMFLYYFKIFFCLDDYIDIDTRDLTTRYANDVIASCAFGLKVDSQIEKENQFYVMGTTAITFNFRQMMMLFLQLISPKLVKVNSEHNFNG